MQINATVQDGQIRGHRMTQLQGQEAVEYQKKQLRQKKDSLIFTPSDAGKEKFAFKNLKQENDAYDPTQIKEEFDFLMDTETTGRRSAYSLSNFSTRTNTTWYARLCFPTDTR